MEWADRYRYLSQESSSIPGRWKTSTVEVARGPMLAVTDPRVKKITVMGPTQLMKTELLNNIVGYFIHQDPSPIIVMQPTGKMAEAWSKDRLDKMLRDTPVLKDSVKEKRSRDSDNTILHKSFPGGHITIVGSNSPSDLAMRPVRIVLCDEVDKYPASAGHEGDPIKLIEERSATFWNALSVRVCSPTVEGASNIEREYLLSDQRVFHGLCPFCNEPENLKWGQVHWDKDNIEETTHYECSHCHNKWFDGERIQAIAKGYYIAQAPFNGHAGFRCNKLASPWQPLYILVQKWLEAQESTEKLKTFINTQLAETWKERGEKPDYMRLYERREQYHPNEIPEGVVFLTAGADVQKDRIEVEIVGWGRDKQSWSIDYRVIMGQTHLKETWDNLTDLLNEKWRNTNGLDLEIQMLAVDSGFNTQHVYEWVRDKSAARVRAIKGSDSLSTMFGHPKDIDLNSKGTKLRRACKIWPVGVSIIKTEIYGYLSMHGAGDDGKYRPGFCHFPQYDEEHFKRLCSEQLMRKKVNGRDVFYWSKYYERNEQLDCRVYARAAAAMFGLDRMKSTDFDYLEGLFDLPEKNDIIKKSETGPKITTQDPKKDFWERQRNRKLF